ncbi:hypothetical protein C8R43DRAFT_1109522 [Mycena crocata]|nr:hypothetical protein C8R43DRAFT_1109522 [Mycena crocata]
MSGEGMVFLYDFDIIRHPWHDWQAINFPTPPLNRNTVAETYYVHYPREKDKVFPKEKIRPEISVGKNNLREKASSFLNFFLWEDHERSGWETIFYSSSPDFPRK